MRAGAGGHSPGRRRCLLLLALLFALAAPPEKALAAARVHTYSAASTAAYDLLAAQLAESGAFFVPTLDMAAVSAIEQDFSLTFLGGLNVGYHHILTESGTFCVPDADPALVRREAANHQAAARILNQVIQNCAGLSVYEKLLCYHDFLCASIDYDYAGYEGRAGRPSYRSVYDALSKGLSVCDGYVRAFYWLCGRSGIPVRCVTDGSHAWNEVLYDGAWRKVDVTWDDGGWGYTYFLVSP